MDSLFELLFKHRPLLYERGEISLAAEWPVWTMVGIGSALALLALVTYLPGKAEADRLDRATLATLRLLALTVVVVCLLQPVLVIRSTVPQRNFVAVLLDDSRSMSIADRPGSPRSAFVSASFGDPGAGLRGALEERFTVRYFRFGEETERIESNRPITAPALPPSRGAVRRASRSAGASRRSDRRSRSESG